MHNQRPVDGGGENAVSTTTTVANQSAQSSSSSTTTNPTPQANPTTAQTTTSDQQRQQQQLRTEEHRRHLRQSYFTLIQDTHDHRGDLIEPGTDRLDNIFRKGNQLLQDVTHAREGALDTHWFKMTSELSVEQARKIDIHSRIKPEDFISRLKHQYLRKPGSAAAAASSTSPNANAAGSSSSTRRKSTRQDKGKGRVDVNAVPTADREEEEEPASPALNRSAVASMSEMEEEDGEQVVHHFDWRGLGREVGGYFRRSPSLSFLFGPLKMELKTRVVTQRKRHQRFEELEAEHPEEVATQEKTMNETSKRVEAIRKRLKREETQSSNHAASFLNLVIDPTSFGKSVENIFYFSFLVKDGHASLKLPSSSNEGIVVNTAEPPTANQFKSGIGEKKQAVLKFDGNIFQQLVQKFQSNPQPQQSASQSSSMPQPTTQPPQPR